MTSADDIRTFSEKHSPVFVVGMERGGTSILCQTLATAPCFGDLKGGQETFVFDAPNALLEGSAGDMTRQYLGGDQDWRAFFNWYQSIRDWDDTWMPPRRIITSYFYYASRIAHDNARIIEKTPRHVFSIPMMVRFFPLCRIIGILRHPFGVIESYGKRLARERRLGVASRHSAWLDRSPDQICAHIAKVTEAAHEGQRQYPRNMMVVSYEETLRDPELVFDLIGAFANISGIVVNAADEVPQLDNSSVDPLLQTRKIIRGNEFRSSLDLETRRRLVATYPELFAETAGISCHLSK